MQNNSLRRLLFIATRQCHRPLDGRSRMLRQWVDSLRGRYEVHYVYMDREVVAGAMATVRRDDHWIEYPCPTPGWLNRLGSLVGRRGRALQEHYFWNPGFACRVAAIAADVKPETIVVDMARMYQYVPVSEGARIVVDLDDLLSLRYTRMLAQGKTPTAGRFVAPATALAEAAMRALPGVGRGVLRLERAAIARLEYRIVKEADAVVMTSPLEADVLRAKGADGLKITAIPPGFEVLSAPMLAPPRGHVTLGFFGNLDYAPNLESLDFLNTAVVPMLARMPGIRLMVAGNCANPDRLRKRLSPEVAFLGAVSSSREFYEKADIVLAPTFSGSGIRIKVLEAFSYGKPVIGTSMAFEGIALSGMGRYSFENPDQMLSQIRSLLSDWPSVHIDLKRIQTDLLAQGSPEHVKRLYLEVCDAQPDKHRPVSIQNVRTKRRLAS